MVNPGRAPSVFPKCGSHSATNNTLFVSLMTDLFYGTTTEIIRLTERGCGHSLWFGLYISIAFSVCWLLLNFIAQLVILEIWQPDPTCAHKHPHNTPKLDDLSTSWNNRFFCNDVKAIRRPPVYEMILTIQFRHLNVIRNIQAVLVNFSTRSKTHTRCHK